MPTSGKSSSQVADVVRCSAIARSPTRPRSRASPASACPAARLMMRLRAEAGDIGGALSVYKRLWDLLGEEYDVEPSKKTQELVAALKLAQPLSESPATALRPSSATPAVASQPRTDQSQDE